MVNDISTCYNKDSTGAPTTAKNVQGTIAESLLNKKEHTFFFQLHSPLETFHSLILNDVELGLTVRFSDSAKFFTSTKENIDPKLIIKGTILFRCVLTSL